MASYRLQLIDCGKPRCTRCRRGPSHGPYWYAFWKERGRSRSRYIGRARPGWSPADPARAWDPHGAPRPRAPSSGDYERLGLQPGASFDDVKRAYRAATRKAHPDRGGSHWLQVRLNQAFERLRRQLEA